MRDKFKHIFFILCSIVLSVASLFCYSAVANAESVAAERNIDVFIGDSTTDGTGLSGYKYGDYSIVQKLDTWAKSFFAEKIMLNVLIMLMVELGS